MISPSYWFMIIIFIADFYRLTILDSCFFNIKKGVSMVQRFLVYGFLIIQSYHLFGMQIRKNKRKTFESIIESSSSRDVACAIMTARAGRSFYTSQRSSGIYNPAVPEFRLSRSKLENFVQCPTCFYIDRRLGTGTPPGYPFSLNSAVDELLKKEFDAYRARQEVHPLCLAAGLDVVPFAHRDINAWRNSLSAGLQTKIRGTNILLQGGIDDVWQDRATHELIVVDYKATSKKDQVSLDADWQDGYKRQVEVYQYLLRNQGYKVSDTAYFVYANGISDASSFDNILKFNTRLLPYEGNDAGVEPTVIAAYECLQSDTIPSDVRAQQLAARCQMCQYAVARARHVAQRTDDAQEAI